MADLNKVFLIGRLTQDPELRWTPNGSAVTDLRLATSRNYTTKDGDRREETLYIDVTVWNRQAENCCQYLAKGRQIHVEGYLKMDSWDDKTTGEKRTKVKVEADRVQFLDGRRDGGDAGHEDDSAPQGRDEAPSYRRSTPPAESRSGNGATRGGHGGSSAAPKRPTPPPPPENDVEDDIPF
jgi:single-strand DNA-binding protein